MCEQEVEIANSGQMVCRRIGIGFGLDFPAILFQEAQ